MFVERDNNPDTWAYRPWNKKASPVVWEVGDLAIPIMPQTLGELDREVMSLRISMLETYSW